MAGHALMKARPAAADVKNLLLKIKLDNAKRSKALVAMTTPVDNHDDANTSSIGNHTTPWYFSGGGCCGGAHYIGSSFSKPMSLGASAAVVDNNRASDKMYSECIVLKHGINRMHNYDMLMPLHRNIYAFSSLDTSNSLAHHTQEEHDYIEKQPIKTAFEEMGSFTSMSKIIPATDTDKDIENEFALIKNQRIAEEDTVNEDRALNNFLNYCSRKLSGLPAPYSRKWKNSTIQSTLEGKMKDDVKGQIDIKEENIRVLQWNVLSQTLGTKNDNFVRCPEAALDWNTRRFRMLEEIARHDADIICLQEVDHFPLLKEALACLNYDGYFFPKPDSPCLYLAENAGPDGCAIFYKRNRFDLEKVESRVIEVWCVQSNQVVLSTILRSKLTQSKIHVATTHLKARNGALLSTLRNEQGKDLLAYLERLSCDGDIPIICAGDFNAEPTEPVYQTITDGLGNISLQSAYAAASEDKNIGHQQEPNYTTWKIREDGEHIQTLDYIFYHSPSPAPSDINLDNDISPRAQESAERDTSPFVNNLQVEKVLDFPTGSQIGNNRLPNLAFASDHLSLLVDFKFTSMVSAPEE